jgi:hypothetical protein
VDEVEKKGLCGMEVVEVSSPYDHVDITSLKALWIAYCRCLARCHGSSWNYGHAQEHYRQGGCSILSSTTEGN